MKKILLVYGTFMLSLLSCRDNKKKSEGKQSDSKKKEFQDIRIKLYPVDTSFAPYFPDTSLVFIDEKTRKEYWGSYYQNFSKFCKYKRSLNVNQDSMQLVIRAAQIHAQDLFEIINFKYCQNVKDINSMNLLSEASPFSNIVPLQERLALFDSFPSRLKESPTGKRTLHTLTTLTVHNSIGQNIHQYGWTELVNQNNQMTNMTEALNVSDYQILIFGASWCSPCILGERQLKEWIPLIDTGNIKIIGVSIDTDRSKWLNYIKKEKYPWSCYLLKNGGMDNEMVKKLGFESIPRNFLLDKSGKVLAENIDIRKILQQIPLIKTE